MIIMSCELFTEGYGESLGIFHDTETMAETLSRVTGEWPNKCELIINLYLAADADWLPSHGTPQPELIIKNQTFIIDC